MTLLPMCGFIAQLVVHRTGIAEVIIIIITLFNEGRDIDYWSPSSFHNGPPRVMGSNPVEALILRKIV